MVGRLGVCRSTVWIWAWAYSFRTGKGPYAALQRQAEKQKKGIFSTQEAAMSPALFRKFHGICHGN
jgi:endonuclease YncB( thermonuclease family)